MGKERNNSVYTDREVIKQREIARNREKRVPNSIPEWSKNYTKCLASRDTIMGFGGPCNKLWTRGLVTHLKRSGVEDFKTEAALIRQQVEEEYRANKAQHLQEEINDQIRTRPPFINTLRNSISPFG